MIFPNTSVLDDFNRSDEGPPLSSSWVTPAGWDGWEVSGNVAAPDAVVTGVVAMWNTSYATDQEVFVTISTVAAGSSPAVFVRGSSTGYSSASYDDYEVFWTNEAAPGADNLLIYKTVNDVATQLGGSILTADQASGNQLGMRVQGTTIEVYIDGVSQGTRTDADVTAAGYLGVFGDVASLRLDNFGGGAVPGSRVVPGSITGGRLTGGQLIR